MKNVILAGFDNYVFSSSDLLNPKEYKLIGYATTLEAAWNIYDKEGNLFEQIQEMPIMPIDTAIGYEPDLIILAATDSEDNELLKYAIYRANYQGEVISLFDFYKGFSVKTAAIRKIAWRMNELGVEGSIAELGAYRGDISWQMNALMPERKLFLFDTFTGYAARDIEKEVELQLSDSHIGEYSFTRRELDSLEENLLGRMPYPKKVEIRKGWFPQTANELEDEKYAFVYMDAGLYLPTVAGIQYFFPRMNRGGVIMISGYEDGKKRSVRQALDDLEQQYGAFLITPLCDIEGTILITHP